jgi:hypothetical protein
MSGMVVFSFQSLCLEVECADKELWPTESRKSIRKNPSHRAASVCEEACLHLKSTIEPYQIHAGRRKKTTSAGTLVTIAGKNLTAFVSAANISISTW